MINSKKLKSRAVRIILSSLALLLLILLIFAEYRYPTFFRNTLPSRLGLSSEIADDDEHFFVHYIDVGQADCSLLKYQSSVVMIDAGDVDSYSKISNYLDSLGIVSIDYLILTHMHSDHIGSARKVIENYNVSNVIMTKLPERNMPTNDVFSGLLDCLSAYDGRIIEARAGDSYALEGFDFSIIAPVKQYEDLNNGSIVVMAHFEKNRFLFMGDAEYESELDIIESKADVCADVLKLGHHGSSSSTVEAFLNAVSPNVAVVSCGRDNVYGHPDGIIINRLDRFGIDIYRTDFQGNITIESDGNNYRVITEVVNE